MSAAGVAIATRAMQADRGGDWRTRAKCRGMWALFDVDIGSHASTAQKVCAGCPVRAECLEDAMSDEGSIWKTYRTGVRGGLTSTQRYQLQRCRTGRCAHQKGGCFRELAS